MIITYQGVEFFKVQFGETVIAFNPVSKESKFKTSRFGANIALITAQHPDFNGADQASIGDKAPFVISGPGEYEVRDIFIRGYLSSSLYGLSDGIKPLINTIYTLTVDNMRICFLGALSSTELSAETKAAFDDIDILFVPIGGQGVLDPAEAYKFAVKLEPKIIIPMHFDEKGGLGDKGALKTFLKEGDATGVKGMDKLTIKRKDLDGKEGEIVVLDPQV